MTAIEAVLFLGYRSLEDFGRSCGCYGSERSALATELQRRGRELEEEEPLPAAEVAPANESPATVEVSDVTTGGAGEEGASSSPVGEVAPASSSTMPPPASIPNQKGGERGEDPLPPPALTSVGDNQVQRPRGPGGRFARKGEA